MTDWSLLRGDPAPGDVVAGQAAARSIMDAGQHAQTLAAALRRAEAGAEATSWKGPAADVVLQRMSGVPPLLDQMAESHGVAGRALADYCTRLAELQAWAQRELARAQQANAARASAASRQMQAQQEFQGALSHRDQAERDLATHQVQLRHAEGAVPSDPSAIASLRSIVMSDQRRIVTAQSAMNGAASRRDAAARVVHDIDAVIANAVRQAEAIREVQRQVSTVTARALEDAARVRIPDDPMFLKVGRYVVDVTRPNSATEAYIGFINGLSNAASLLGFIPFLKPVAGAVVAGLQITILACRVAQALYGQRSWGSLVGEAGLAAVSLGGVLFGGVLKSSSILSQAKRFVWYDDARHATGLFRAVHVDAKVAAKIMASFPGASGATVYRAAALFSWGKTAARGVEVGSTIYYDASAGRWGSVAGDVVDVVAGEGTASHIGEVVDEASRGDYTAMGNDAAFVLEGEKGERAYVAAQGALQAAVEGDATEAMKAGAVFVMGKSEVQLLDQVAGDLSQGEFGNAWGRFEDAP